MGEKRTNLERQILLQTRELLHLALPLRGRHTAHHIISHQFTLALPFRIRLRGGLSFCWGWTRQFRKPTLDTLECALCVHDRVPEAPRCEVEHHAQLVVRLRDLARAPREQPVFELESGLVVGDCLVEFFCVQ